MSYPVFDSSIVPVGLTGGGFKKTPHFNNLRNKTTGGQRSNIALMPYATWDFEVDIMQFGQAVLNEFVGCYLATSGGGFFLFTDPQDSAVDTTSGIMLNVTAGAASPMGKQGDGVSTKFQLARAIGQGVDVLQNVTVTSLKVDGATVTGSVSSTGVVTFDVAPGAGATLSWVGSFQYLCQFTEDTIKDLAAVSRNADGYLWTCSSVAFESLFNPSVS
jgi:hypothetical protein